MKIVFWSFSQTTLTTEMFLFFFEGREGCNSHEWDVLVCENDLKSPDCNLTSDINNPQCKPGETYGEPESIDWDLCETYNTTRKYCPESWPVMVNSAGTSTYSNGN